MDYVPSDNEVPSQEPILGEGSMAHLKSRHQQMSDFLRGTLRQAKKLPENVLGAAEATASLGSALGLMIPSFVSGAIRQEPAGAMMERNMYVPRTEAGARHLQGAAEVLGSIPDVGPLPELQPFVGVSKGVGQQLQGAARKAGQKLEQAGMAAERAMEPIVRSGIERGGITAEMLRGITHGSASHVVKPPHGNWLNGQNAAGVVENQLGKLKIAGTVTPEWYEEHHRLAAQAKAKGDERAASAINQDIERIRRNDAINNWIERNLTNYVKKEMGTPEDPVRKLAEQGILHMEPYGTREAGSLVMRKRAGLNYPAQGLGKSEQAQFWERLSDSAIDAYSAGSYKHGALDESFMQSNPWLAKTPDETLIYTGKGLTRDLGFDHIVDVLRQDLNEGRIRPEQLNKVSMEQAVRRTHEYDQEMAKRMAEAQIKATEGMPVYKEYPEQGFKWVELTLPKELKLPEGYRLESDPSMWGDMQSGYRLYDPSGKSVSYGKTEEEAISSGLGEQKLKDALKYEGETMGHCVGGYCPDVLEGRSRIFSLRDSKGEPHVTIEVNPSGYRDVYRALPLDERGKINSMVEDWTSNIDYRPSPEDIQAKTEQIMSQMGYKPTESITQIKGKQNRKPKDEYLPFVQDFVRSGNWSKVGDPQNAGLRKYTDVFNVAEQRKIEALNLPVPDHLYLTGEQIQTLHNAINPEGKRLKYDAYGNIIDDNYASGGLVSNTDRIAEQLRANGMDEEAAFNRALMLANQVEMAGGGSVAKAAAKAAGKTARKVEYETAQQGPFFRVQARTPETSGQFYRGIREQVQEPPETLGGTIGANVPQSISGDAVRQMMADPSNFVRSAADQYAREYAGGPYDLPQIPQSSLAKQSAIGRVFQLAAEDDPAYKKAVFDAYAKRFPKMVEASGAKDYDQLVQAAYMQLAKETEQQFNSLPVRMSFHRQGEGNYLDSNEMLRDVYGNKHLYVYQGGEPHPFLNVIDPRTGLNSNEMFRAVHDFYGHAIHGNQFGPKGEETAWAAHSKMFSPLARLAMTSETRGQNSFVNYTPLNAELKRRINKLNELAYEAGRAGKADDVKAIKGKIAEAFQDFQFAPQKSVLLPPEFVDYQYSGGMPNYIQPLVKPETGTTAASELTHYSNVPSLTQTNPSMYGTGIAGEEAKRLAGFQGAVKDRTYFYTGEPGSVRPEVGLGPHRYKAKSSQLYDISEDPLLLRTLAAEANRTPYTSPYNKGLTDPGQSFTDVERMVKEYGYEGLMNPQQRTAIMYGPTPVEPFAKGGKVSGLSALRKKHGN